ncbi:MAG: DUF2169 domain-containing protein [Deltaproteobacteria bacterium]|nr:DUF2169 domain-containing protein [Deltaproteobacteria bacterium]
MDVVSHCPLLVGSRVCQPRAGAFAMLVVCKATCQLTPGRLSLAPAQLGLIENDWYWSDSPSSSMYAPSDFVPQKARADVLLVGHAYASQGLPVRSLVARLAVGGVEKSIEIVGDRAWDRDGRLVEGAPFSKMPLRYERAAGGPGTVNPVGIPADAKPDPHGHAALPNLQPVGTRVLGRADRIEPIGFGPIAPGWPARIQMLRGLASSWSYALWQDRPLPEQLDWAYFNTAPADQQLEVLRCPPQSRSAPR